MVAMHIPVELTQGDLVAYHRALREFQHAAEKGEVVAYARELREFLKEIGARDYQPQQLTALLGAFNRDMAVELSQVEKNAIYAQAAARVGWVETADVLQLHPWEVNQIVIDVSAAITKANTIPKN